MSSTRVGPHPELLTGDPECLLPRFGLDSFRPGQRDVVDALANGDDCLCVMPTGGGKSLCYQLPALQREGTTIVVSPLIALMKDQVDSLRSRDIAARLINSSLSLREQESVMDEMAAGILDLVYVAPERLRNSRFLERVRDANITLLAVDEAHCVSEWGHDFRPDYSRLGRFRDRYLKGVQTIGLTATATPAVRDDIRELLHLDKPRVFVTGFARENLRFSAQTCHNDVAKQKALGRYLRRHQGAGIIYAATRKRCEEIASWLPAACGRDVGVYHAGLLPEDRRSVQDAFMSGKLPIIVATNAFGMGIDKADIRFVVHYNLPGSLEAYYQEAGRAGRDGSMSDCLLLFAYSDRQIQEYFIENRYPSRDTVRKVYEYLLSLEQDPIELTLDEVREAIAVKDGTEAIGTSETLLARAEVLKRLDSSANQAVVRIDSEEPTLLDFLPPEAKLRRRVMAAVEKVIGNQRGEDVYVKPKRLAELAGVDRTQLTRVLRELQGLRSFDYVPPFRGRAVHFLRRDLTFDQLNIDFEELERRKASEYEKLEAVIAFARSKRCRQRVILDYFGDPDASDCLRCDRCDPNGIAVADPTSVVAHPSVGTGSLEDSQDNQAVDEAALVTGIRVILSGVTRTHGRIGKMLIAQMLAGSKNKRVTQLRLNRLSTYGMLEGMRQSELAMLIDELIAVGLLEQKEISERRPTIHMTELGREMMHRGNRIPEELSIRFPLARKLAAVAQRIQTGDVDSRQSDEAPENAVPLDDRLSDEGRASDTSSLTAPSERLPREASRVGSTSNESLVRDLTDQLKRFRRKRSAALNVPPHRILPGSVIDAIANLQPANTSQLESVDGITPEFLETYGNDLLELISATVANSQPGHDTKQLTDSSAPNALRSTREGVGDDATRISPGHVDAGLPATDAADTKLSLKSDATIIAEEDCYWTWRLFRDGYAWSQVAKIRNLSNDVMQEHLRLAAVAGHPVDSDWSP
ncbi:MAG: RecQ family ATP-dependent DNA helicase [Planctomycetota bacterium]